MDSSDNDRKSKTDGRKKSSYVWKLYKRMDGDRALCTLCKAVLSHKSGSSNLGKHLSKKHPIEFKKAHPVEINLQCPNEKRFKKKSKIKFVETKEESSSSDSLDSFNDNLFSDYEKLTDSKVGLDKNVNQENGNIEIEEFTFVPVSSEDPLQSQTDNHILVSIPTVPERGRGAIQAPSHLTQHQLLLMNHLFLKEMAESQGIDVGHIEEIATRSGTGDQSDKLHPQRLSKLNKSNRNEALSTFIIQQLSQITHTKLFHTVQFKLLQILHQGNIDQLTLEASNHVKGTD